MHNYKQIAEENHYSIDNDGEGPLPRSWAWWNHYLGFGSDNVYQSEEEAWKAACVENNLIKDV